MIHIIQPVQKKSIYTVSSMQELKQPPMFQALQAKDLLLFLATSSAGIDSSKVQPHCQPHRDKGRQSLLILISLLIDHCQWAFTDWRSAWTKTLTAFFGCKKVEMVQIWLEFFAAGSFREALEWITVKCSCFLLQILQN